MRERIFWSPGLWILTLTLDLAIALSIGVALSDQQLLLLLALLIGLTITFWWATRLTINVDEEMLYLGRARIDAQFIADIIELDREQMRYERGPGLDPRAFLALRFWVPTGVKVILKDERDPTPYWLFSTRRANEIKRALKKS